MTVSALSVSPEALRFSSAQEADLTDRLAGLDRAAVLSPLSSAREVLMDVDGRTLADGYRLTDWALYQLCQYLCTGLHRLVQDLLARDQLRGTEVAREVMDRLVRLRFDRLYGKQVLRDKERRLVEGIVGPAYRWLSNRTLHERVGSVAKAAGSRFLGAVLAGRWLLVRYVAPAPYFTAGPDVFYRGYHVSNHEVGASSIKAAGMLLRAAGKVAALTPIAAASRVRHQGRRFEAKLNKLLAHVASRLRPAGDYAASFAALRESLLGLGGTPDARQARMESLASVLSGTGSATPGVARQVVLSAVMQGGDDKPAADSAAALSPLVYQGRSAYDVYVAAGRVAKRLPIGQREKVEQLAYAILSGKVTLTKAK